jgi:hypothetical protein
MTNITTISTHSRTQGHSQPHPHNSDGAPMVITKLSGWIDMTEPKATTPGWIIRLRHDSHAR